MAENTVTSPGGSNNNNDGNYDLSKLLIERKTVGAEFLRLGLRGSSLGFSLGADLEGPFAKAAINGSQIDNFEDLEIWEDSSTFFIPPVPVTANTASSASHKNIVGPLYDVGGGGGGSLLGLGLNLPHLSDSISSALTIDVWDWQSSEIDLTSSGNNDTLIPHAAKLESKLTVEKRGCVVWNLFETEQNYCMQLAVIQNYFYKKLIEKNIVTEHSANLIFSGISDLLQFHMNFYKQMESILQDWDPAETAIGALFSEHVSDLRTLYTKFIDNYAISQKCIKKEEKENPEYSSFMKESAKLPETSRQTLKDFLITPVQRTTRYHLLLKDLLKSTKEHHPDFHDLESAWATMANLATAVNDKKRQEEEATGLFDAYEQTKHCPPTLISHKRRMIFSADTVCPKTNRSIRLVLCSDLLMLSLKTSKEFFAQLNLGGSQAQEYNYRFLRWLDLLETEVVDMHAVKPNTIRITHNPESASSAGADRKSNSTPVNEIPAVAKDLGAISFSLQFSGYDALKSRLNFLKAIATVTKTVRDETLKRG